MTRDIRSLAPLAVAVLGAAPAVAGPQGLTLAELEAAHLDCQLAVQLRIPSPDEAADCAAIYAELQARLYETDVRRLRAWYQSEQQAG